MNCTHEYIAEREGHAVASCTKCGFRYDTIYPPRDRAQRQAPPLTYYPDAALNLHHAVCPAGYYPKFNEALAQRGITAEQAREAANLLNQLAEYLECIGR